MPEAPVLRPSCSCCSHALPLSLPHVLLFSSSQYLLVLPLLPYPTPRHPLVSQVLLFSSSVRLLRIVEALCVQRGHDYLFLDGSTPMGVGEGRGGWEGGGRR